MAPVIDVNLGGCYSVKNHPLSGVTLLQWARLLRARWTQIDILTYWPRLLFLTLMAALNTIGAIADWILYDAKIRAQELNDEPVFVLGHPRTGTTHLHNLLSKDSRFAYANTFQVGFPSSFLSTSWLAPYMGLIMDSTRPMDNMALAWDTPQEDEVAVNQLSSGASPYAPLLFMRREPEFRKFYDFDDCDTEDFARWRDSFVYFLKKIQFAAGGAHRRLLLKSPVHTARVKLLREMFPKATFIFVHRHPYEVFKSAVTMADRYYWQCYLQKPRVEDVQEFILYQGALLHRKYTEDVRGVPEAQKMEVSFEEVTENTVTALSQVYKALGWGKDFARFKPVVEAYSQSLRDFKMNEHKELGEDARAVVRERWKAWFDDLGYTR